MQEQELSFKCLNKTNFDREKCEIFFVNYNNCKEFWVSFRNLENEYILNTFESSSEQSAWRSSCQRNRALSASSGGSCGY